MLKAGGTGKDDAKTDEEASDSKEFKGIIREVQCQKQKVALMPMTPTPERKLKVRFSEPFFDTVSLSIMMKKPILQ
jgi:ABC-type amino acid transport substrate-binding protein